MTAANLENNCEINLTKLFDLVIKFVIMRECEQSSIAWKNDELKDAMNNLSRLGVSTQREVPGKHGKCGLKIVQIPSQRRVFDKSAKN